LEFGHFGAGGGVEVGRREVVVRLMLGWIEQLQRVVLVGVIEEVGE
jgi:hypothetical protein